MDFLQTVLWFLVALGILVTFHEFGHFYVARRCGVKVLRFSVGFGKKLWSFYDKKGTEFVVAAIPLGGYVKMLDEREGEVAPEELPYAFTQKNVWQRIAIVAAGPVANFILAVLLYWVLFLPGSIGVAPVIDSVKEESPAAMAGLEAGQEIIAVDGKPTPTREALAHALLNRLGETGEISMTATYPKSDLRYQSYIAIDSWLSDVEEPDPIGGLGLALYYPPIELAVADVAPGSAADQAGLKVGDKLLAVDGETINDWSSWVDTVQASPEKPLALLIRRDDIEKTVTVTPQRLVLDSGEVIGRIGVTGSRASWPEEMLRKEEYSIAGAFVKAVDKTWATSAFVLMSVKKLITGHIAVNNLSGPITIAKVAGDSASYGWKSFLRFLALVSISLGVFNLLPIPVLDGGHLLYYLIEAVKGSPVNEKVQLVGYQIGMAMLMGVMIMALYFDVLRLGN